MRRAWVYPFAGGGIGFLVGFAIVQVMAGAAPSSDSSATTLFVGTFLAGAGAIAGAITGAVESFRSSQQPIEASAQST